MTAAELFGECLNKILISNGCALTKEKSENLRPKVVLLTGDELRHRYFRKKLADNESIKVLQSFCEGLEKSLLNYIDSRPYSSNLMREHVRTRGDSERKFFGDYIDRGEDKSLPIKLKKGAINKAWVHKKIIDLDPDLIICFGCSLINVCLINKFRNKIINCHLGLSPFYRGSGTNIWPLIHGRPDLVGATFMWLDEGVDTGDIIHQVRPLLYPTDTPHDIGNRIIVQMTDVIQRIILNVTDLESQVQSMAASKPYKQADFDNDACALLYRRFEDGLIERYLASKTPPEKIYENERLFDEGNHVPLYRRG